MTESEVRSIEMVFPFAVNISPQVQKGLLSCAKQICKENCPEGYVMWPSGVGSKITYMPMTKDEEDAGLHTEFDDTVFQIGISARPKHSGEQKS